MTEISPLRRRMIEDMTVRNLSPATQRSYVHAVAKFARFFGRSPETLDLEDVRLPGSPGCWRHVLAGTQSDGLPPSLPLRRDTQATGPSEADLHTRASRKSFRWC